MKLKFKIQEYQTLAVEAVVDCFKGQPHSARIQYRIDPGIRKGIYGYAQMKIEDAPGFRNEDIKLSEAELLKNIQEVQSRQNLPVSDKLIKTKESPANLDIEMETGTGKTYCYIKTIFEMNRRFGWSKFIVVVPSIAIREGVYKSLEITADHFLGLYGEKARFFIYNSRSLHHLEAFSSDAGINIMVINVQAFNARGKDARRIYEELDDFQSRRPIDVLKANRPILILDEPQKMEGKKTLNALREFAPLMILRYSATHKTIHNKVHRLDALDAYNQKLVKKIAVRGISVKGLSGTNAYLYLESIEISRKSPAARMEIEVKGAGGAIKRTFRKLHHGDNLFDLSNGLEQYRGFVISDINANTDSVSFTNGVELTSGEATGDVNEMTLRRIQIREAIKSHLDKERILFHKGIKVLTLFFIDEVAKYRDYSQPDEKGEYARIFEEEYRDCVQELGLLLEPEYRKYLDGIGVSRTHNGYFSIDKKTRRLVDPKMTKTEMKKGETSDVDAYDLILKDKERLLSFEEPTRFIFSHSALREGWDNPNVFVICALKHSDSTISRRQEVGRGLRIAVNRFGDRQDDPATVHETNILTVVANESYKDFVSGLQKDIRESLSERPRVADASYFQGKILLLPDGKKEVTPQMAKQIYRYLVKHDYTDDNDHITREYIEAAEQGRQASLPEELETYKEQIFQLIDTVYSDAKLPLPEDERKSRPNPLNDNFYKKEFRELWDRINRKAAYTVHFSSAELVEKCVSTINRQMRVARMRYTIQEGEQKGELSYEGMSEGTGFKVISTKTETEHKSIHSAVRYDLIGKIAEAVQLTRRTVADILGSLEKPVFTQFRLNPEAFISEAARLISEQKATVIIEYLSYDMMNDAYGIDIFTKGQVRQDFSRAKGPLKRHIYDYVITDSSVEQNFVSDLDTSSEVAVYAKLPRGFFIPTPVGNYNPDWAIAFREGKVRHIYFVAETKGSMSTMELREIEKTKIECARKFFDEINRCISPENVKYDVVDSYAKLMEIVGVKEAA